ncbi:hypothetical protein, partial [Ralstonia pseudosolanacearum]|uniref:hypothetical protein n=1 Tax=Ralstonia pseudosolanacearum TaxID=1310165 RepID=UPI0020057762
VAGGHSATIYPDGRIRGDRKFSLLVNALGSVWRKFYESRSTLVFARLPIVDANINENHFHL